ncbi:MAG: SufE family protein [Bacteroidota bacterium]|nr:SufE family protein [Bacteroidota bacterium]
MAENTLIDTRKQELISEFDMIGEDWTERYNYIIELGAELPPFPEPFRDDAHKVKGCQSSVWLHASQIDNKIELKGDSDALIVKGLVALVLRIYNQQKPMDVVQADLSWMEQLGLQQHLSPTRKNGLDAMIRQIRLYATAFQAQNQLNEPN